MLITCPECNLQISDKAVTCPHCGYPMVSDIKRAYTKPTKRAHRKLPNGFGSITEIKGRYLRNPFLVRISTENGMHNLKPKAYFKTYNEAYEALVEYNKSPYDLANSWSMKDLYERWSKKYFQEIATGSVRGFTGSWKKCSAIYDIPVKNIKAADLHEIIDAEPSAQMKCKLKSMFDKMLDYAMEYEVVDRNVSRTFSLSKKIIEQTKEIQQPHVALTVEEVNKLWENINEECVDMILIQIYTGLRPQELITIKNENIHLEEGYFTAGLKTKAGKNRIIPIHKKIKELIIKRMNDSEYLFEKDGFWKYKRLFEKMLPGHRPHDARKTFATYAARSGMDEMAIKRIMGHQLDITEGTYTERSLSWLQSEMDKFDVQTE